MSLANGGPQSSTSTVKRSRNDIRIKEASPDVINDLLASLSTISLPADSDSYSPLIPDREASLRSPPPSVRASSSQRPSAPTSIFSREPSASFQEEPQSAAASSSSIGEVSVTHVADSPTIRTSRRPSGYSKITAPKSSQKTKPSQNLRSPYAPSPNTTAPPSRQRQEPTLPQLPEEATTPPKTIKSKKTSDEARRARALTARTQRDSLQVTRSRDTKGKQKASSDSPTTPLYSPLEPPPPQSLQGHIPYQRSRSPTTKPTQRLFLSEQVSPAARSPARAPRGQDDLYTSRTSSRTIRPERSTENFVIVHRKKDEVAAPPSDRRKVIPSRSSSVGRTSGSPPKFGRSSRRSSLRSQHQSPETVPEEKNEDEQAAVGHQESSAQAGTVQEEPEEFEMEEENSVMRRIRELRAAKEQRDKTSQQSVISNPNQLATPSSPRNTTTPRQRPPDTSRAATQVQEATRVKERKISVKTDGQVQTLEPPPAISSGSASPTRASFSRPRPTGVDGRPLSPMGALSGAPFPRKSPLNANPVTFAQDVPLSRSASRIKRWSNPDLAAAKKSYQRHTRDDSSKTEKGVAASPPLLEEKPPNENDVSDAVEKFVNSPRLSQRITPSGESRVISFSEVGDPFGHAVFCCVGMGLTRYVMAFYEELATSLKLRLITLERPGIGESTPYQEPRSPLYWPDDIRAVCNRLSIRNFSLVAHSAGAIYALATALKMPSRVRGRIHLLAPWIPPSQLSSQSTSNSPSGSPAKVQALPRAQRFLRYVPTPLLRLGSSSYGMGKPVGQQSPTPKNGKSSSTSAMTSPRPSMGSKTFSNGPSFLAVSTRPSVDRRQGIIGLPAGSPRLEDLVTVPSDHNLAAAVLSAGRDAAATPPPINRARSTTSPEESMAWQKRYDVELTATIWELATRNANPAVDLFVCLERNSPVGFRYRDVAREVVIRHGSKDTRVPLDNVKWLGTQVLQKAEVRILEGEGHGLMANAGVMASVLAEVGKEAEMGDTYGNLGSNSAYNSPVLETEAATF